MIWALYLVLLHIAALIGLVLLAWVTGVVLKKGNGKFADDEFEATEMSARARTSIYHGPSSGWRTVK